MFDPKKYLGTWYQIAHYPSWFEGSATYNTKAVYEKDGDKIKVTNSTNVGGSINVAKGTAVYLGDRKFNVAFPPQKNTTDANYVIQKLWKLNGKYIWSIVTNSDKSQLYVLSRKRNPSLKQVNRVFAYLKKNFDMNKIVMTGQYE